MLGYLTDKMGGALKRLQGLHKISESNMSQALDEVRAALLAADVHFKVTKDFIEKVRQACLGVDVIKSISPGQQAIKIIHDELVKLLGEDTHLFTEATPAHILMVGLHGAGKTTSSAKLARFLTKKGLKPILIACDIYRPAAIDQLSILAKNEGFLFYADPNEKNVIKIAQSGLAYGKEQQATAFIFDTAGRLQIDQELIQELKDLKSYVQPQEILLVADSALGQEAVNVAKSFHEALGLSGIILTKLDGDARGGAALSMKSITGVPIKFMAMGEKMGDFSAFHPDRMAQRILGMGDVVSLVEKAQENLDQNEMMRLQERMMQGEMDLNDFLAQMKQLNKLGSLQSIAKLLPGMGKMQVGDKEQERMKRMQAIILSMTPRERKNPKILNGSRRLRIAKGSGTQVRDINLLLSQFEQMRKMLKAMKGGGMKKMMQQFQNNPNLGRLPF